MSTRVAYKQKIESEFELIQARFAEFKARGKSLTADARIKHAKQVEDLEQRVDATKAKLKELGEANEDVWEELKDGVENSWGALQSAVQDVVTHFKD
jgi:predicted  nucleic acid-binding Zn-ribbon protein